MVGRNGVSKSTLLKIVSGDHAPDSGSVWRAPGLHVATLEQDVPLSTDRPVFDVVADGLGDLSTLVADYHRTAVAVAHEAQPPCSKHSAVFSTSSKSATAGASNSASRWCSRACRSPPAIVDRLSGGWKRRVLPLARSSPIRRAAARRADQPSRSRRDLWLETFLSSIGRRALRHARSRLPSARVATHHRNRPGRLTSWPGDY